MLFTKILIHLLDEFITSFWKATKLIHSSLYLRRASSNLLDKPLVLWITFKIHETTWETKIVRYFCSNSESISITHLYYACYFHFGFERFIISPGFNSNRAIIVTNLLSMLYQIKKGGSERVNKINVISVFLRSPQASVRFLSDFHTLQSTRNLIKLRIRVFMSDPQWAEAVNRIVKASWS